MLAWLFCFPWCGLVLVAAGEQAPAPPLTTHRTVDGITVGLHLPIESIAKGVLPLTIQIANGSAGDLAFVSPRYNADPDLEVTVWYIAAASGKKTPCELTPLGRTYLRCGGMRRTSRVVSKGSTLTYLAKLDRLFDIGIPGSYEVDVALTCHSIATAQKTICTCALEFSLPPEAERSFQEVKAPPSAGDKDEPVTPDAGGVALGGTGGNSAPVKFEVHVLPKDSQDVTVSLCMFSADRKPLHWVEYLNTYQNWTLAVTDSHGKPAPLTAAGKRFLGDRHTTSKSAEDYIDDENGSLIAVSVGTDHGYCTQFNLSTLFDLSAEGSYVLRAERKVLIEKQQWVVSGDVDFRVNLPADLRSEKLASELAVEATKDSQTVVAQGQVKPSNFK
ncbi:MAG: hypothetical protein ACREJ2_01735 [Planctomycetota bacterium]